MDIDFEQLYNDHKKLSKIMFIFNALEDGWTIKKEDQNTFSQSIKVRKKKYFSTII